jgi:hypothetical protein
MNIGAATAAAAMPALSLMKVLRETLSLLMSILTLLFIDFF